jgi:hypothetical protein
MNDFKKVLDFCIQKKLVNARLKGFLSTVGIEDFEQLNIYLNESLNNTKVNRYGEKTIHDLKVFYELFSETKEEQKVNIFIDFPNVSKFTHELYIKLPTIDISKKTRNILNQMTDENELVRIIESNGSNSKIGNISKRVIQELSQIHKQIQINSIAQNDDINNIITEFKTKVDVEISDISILKALVKRVLNLNEFIKIYFDSIFIDLSKSTRNRLRNYLYENSMSIIDNNKVLSKERSRQIFKEIENLDIQKLYYKLKFISDYSSINYFMTEDMIIYSEFISNRFEESYKSSIDNQLTRLIIYILNSNDYIVINPEKLISENLSIIYSNDEIIFCKKENIDIIELDLFKKELSVLYKEKSYREINLKSIFKNYVQDPNIYSSLIKVYLSKNFGDNIIHEPPFICNNKKYTLLNLILSYLKTHSIPKSVDDILQFCKGFEAYAYITTKDLQYIINRRKDLFYNVGKTRYYGLKDDDKKGIISIKDECYKILANSELPLFKDEILFQMRNINKEINKRTVFEILRMYECFKSIGQSFFILSIDTKNYQQPVHRKSFETGLDKLFNHENHWLEIHFIRNYFDSFIMPDYQKSAYYKHLIIECDGFGVKNIDPDNINNLIFMLGDEGLKKIVITYLQTHVYFNEIDLRYQMNAYIERATGVSLSKKELLLIINYYKK